MAMANQNSQYCLLPGMSGMPLEGLTCGQEWGYSPPLGEEAVMTSGWKKGVEWSGGIFVVRGGGVGVGRIIQSIDQIRDAQPKLQTKLDSTDKAIVTLGAQLQQVNTKLNDDVIPWVNKLKGKKSPEIKTTAISSLLGSQRR